MMTDDEHEQRARSFGGLADVYAAARPTYPSEAARWLLGDDTLDGWVVDLAAGTGKLTAVLHELRLPVVAVEPSVGMLQQLRDGLPRVPAAVGTAERLPLRAGIARAITVAQAWHWVEPQAALDEAARVLRPGGALGLIWNQRDGSVPWVAAAWAPVSATTGTDVLPEGWQSTIEQHGAFGPLAAREFRHVQSLTREALVDLVRSRSNVAVRPEPERSAVVAEVLAIVDTHPDTRDREVLELPYVVQAFRTVRP